MRRRRSSKVRYASASAEAKAWGIVVVDAGHAAVPPKSPCPPSRHPRDRHEIASGRVLSGFHFICVASGQGEFETKATGIRRLGAGDLVVLPPGIWHRYGPDFDSGWHLYWLEFDGDLARRWMSCEEFREADPVVPIGACLPSFERVIDLLHSERPGGDLILGALAAEAIAEVLAAIKQGRGKARPVAMVIREARNLLAQGHADPGNMTEFAERRNLSYSVFRRWFKAETGCSPRQFVLQTKMNWAKGMLLSSDATVGRIATELGFDSVFYFTRVFKKRHGMTPSALRASAGVPQANPWAVPSDSTTGSFQSRDGSSGGPRSQAVEDRGFTRSQEVVVPMQPSQRSFFRHLPMSPAARAWGIHVVSGGHAIVLPGSPFPPCQHPADHSGEARGRVLPTYHLLYVAAGRGEFESLGTGLRRLVAGDLVILHPDQWHRYRPAADVGWHGYWLEFDGDLARRWMNRKELLDAGTVVHVGPCQPFLDRMVGLLEDWQPGGECILGSFAMETIAEILAVLEERRRRGRPAGLVIGHAKDLLTQDLTRPARLPDLAARLHVSYTAFRRMFKTETGRSPRQFVLEARMQRAREMLSTTDLTVARIAEGLGYDSVHYFSRLFMKRHGQAPSSFRRSSRVSLPTSPVTLALGESR